MEHLSVEECRRGDFLDRFMELLRRRGEIAREVLVKPKTPLSAKQSPQRQQAAAAEAERRRPLALVLDGTRLGAAADRRSLEWLTHALRALTRENKMDEPDPLRAQAEQLLALARQVRDADPPYTEKLIGEAINLRKGQRR